MKCRPAHECNLLKTREGLRRLSVKRNGDRSFGCDSEGWLKRPVASVASKHIYRFSSNAQFGKASGKQTDAFHDVDINTLIDAKIYSTWCQFGGGASYSRGSQRVLSLKRRRQIRGPPLAPGSSAKNKPDRRPPTPCWYTTTIASQNHLCLSSIYNRSFNLCHRLSWVFSITSVFLRYYLRAVDNCCHETSFAQSHKLQQHPDWGSASTINHSSKCQL